MSTFSQRARTGGWVLIAAVACAAGTLHAFRPALLSGFARMQADPVDTRFNQFVLEHTFRWATDGAYRFELWSPPMFYPHAGTLAYSDNLLGTAPLYWLLRAAAAPDVAYPLWMIACAVLNYAAMAVVLRRLGAHPLLAVAGGFWFAFGLPRTLSINHQQLLPQFFTPVAVYAALRFFEAPATRRLAMAAAAACLQLWAGIYLGWFLALSLAVLTVVVLALSGATRSRLREYVVAHKAATIAVVLASAAAVAPMVPPYLRALADVGPRAFAEAEPYLPRVRSWLPDHALPAWQRALDAVAAPVPATSEANHFFQGYAFLAVVLAAAWALAARRDWLDPPRRVTALACLAAAVALIVLSLHLGDGVTLWRLVHAAVPGAGGIRAVGRIWSVVYVYLSIGGLLGADAVVRHALRSDPARGIATSVLLAVAMAEQWTPRLDSFEVAPRRARVAQMRDLIRGSDAAYAALYRQLTPLEYTAYQIDAMWAGLEANVPVVNGYSGAAPPGYEGYRRTYTPRALFDWWGAAAPDRFTVVAPVEPGLPAAWGSDLPGPKTMNGTTDFVALTADTR